MPERVCIICGSVLGSGDDDPPFVQHSTLEDCIAALIARVQDAFVRLLGITTELMGILRQVLDE